MSDSVYVLEHFHSSVDRRHELSTNVNTWCHSPRVNGGAENKIHLHDVNHGGSFDSIVQV